MTGVITAIGATPHTDVHRPPPPLLQPSSGELAAVPASPNTYGPNPVSYSWLVVGVTVGKRVIEPLSLVGKKCRFPLVHAVVDLVATSCVRAAYDKHSHSDLQDQPKACLEEPCRALEATLYKAFSPSSRTCDAASGGRA